MSNAATDNAKVAMAKQRHLPHAPITEALIDFRVEPHDGFTFVELQRAFTELDFGYYLKNAITEGLFEFKLPADGQAAEAAGQSAQTGLRLHSHDDMYVAQCGLGGFTLSRLPPYEDWPRLIAEAQRLWTFYCQRARPQRVTRVATRFINNLRLPLAPGESFQTYLNRLVDVPDEAPQMVEAFFQRFRLVDAASGARVILTLALDGKAGTTPVPVIFDVDALLETSTEPADGALWDMLGRLRGLKNQCFFGTLTERAAELYA
jgi:uncharacterized protein (TIGR04255 family)